MKVSGFTFVRNAIKYDYPVVQAITSILPVCDEFIACVGKSEDGTEDLIKSIKSDKIKIVNSVWDDSLREGGRVLATETNKAFDAVSPDSDWAFYIQGDEVVHEKYLPTIRQAMQEYMNDKNVECLVLKYLHFYGSYKYVGDSHRWYRREVRVIRNDKSIRSYRDAQGFRRNRKKLKGKLIDAYIYHYGWVRNPYTMQSKDQNFKKFYNGNGEKKVVAQEDLYDYTKINSLKLFGEDHPKVMQDKVSAMDWDFEFDEQKKKFSLKEKILRCVEKHTGKRLFEFRNYKLI
ncbi:MAG: hypothetical protein LBH34_00410 [Prevotellaceae bacterium]|jgi:hypothetical protein|nr:hypothetical protein [Prevotellaceae bacterium]